MKGCGFMNFSAFVFLCITILASTHVLDGILKKSGIKKSLFLLCLGFLFGISLIKTFDLNRYLSLNLMFLTGVISFVILLVSRRNSSLVLKEVSLIFFIMSLFVLHMVWIIVAGSEFFYFFILAATVLYCAVYIRKQVDGAVCAYFGIWFFQFLNIIRNMITDSYIFFDFSNDVILRDSLICALISFIVSYAVNNIYRKDRKRKSGGSGDISVFQRTK